MLVPLKWWEPASPFLGMWVSVVMFELHVLFTGDFCATIRTYQVKYMWKGTQGKPSIINLEILSSGPGITSQN